MSAVLNLAPKRRALMLGSGSEHGKRVTIPDSPDKNFDDYELVTVDIDGDLTPKPSVVWDLDALPYTFGGDSEFDEIHAYEVLEHCGTQGDGKYFFAQFAEFWRMLKPDGLICISVPMWDHQVAWGVPDHKRVLPPNIFGFLEPAYYENVGKPGYADYRKWLGSTNFKIIAMQSTDENFYCVMRAIKPSE